MASIRQRGDTFQITVSNGRDANGKQIREMATFTPDASMTKAQKKKALEKFVVEFEAQVKEGRLLSGEKLTLKRFAEVWLNDYAEKQYEATTLEYTRGILDKIILPAIGHLKLSEIQPLHLSRLYDKLVEEGYKPSSIKRYHNIISSMLSNAVYWQIIYDNPCKRVKPPKEERRKDVKHFTLEETQAFLEYIEEPYTVKHGGRGEKAKMLTDIRKEPLQLKVFYNLAVYGGFRRGEMLALKWEDINFEQNTVEVNKSLAKTKTDGVIIKATKNKTSDRIVTLPRACMKMLKQLQIEQLERKLSMGSAWQGENNIFTQDNGSYMDIATPSQSFKRIINRYNSTHEDKLPIISVHGLRHTSATLLIAQKNDMKTVSSRLGHADVSTTMDIYAHALKKRDEEAAASIEILLQRKA